MIDAQRLKQDRDEVFLELTKSVCPVCKAVIEAEVNVRDNRVIMRKRCRQSGPLKWELPVVRASQPAPLHRRRSSYELRALKRLGCS